MRTHRTRPRVEGLERRDTPSAFARSQGLNAHLRFLSTVAGQGGGLPLAEIQNSLDNYPIAAQYSSQAVGAPVFG